MASIIRKIPKIRIARSYTRAGVAAFQQGITISEDLGTIAGEEPQIPIPASHTAIRMPGEWRYIAVTATATISAHYMDI